MFMINLWTTSLKGLSSHFVLIKTQLTKLKRFFVVVAAYYNHQCDNVWWLFNILGNYTCNVISKYKVPTSLLLASNF